MEDAMLDHGDTATTQLTNRRPAEPSARWSFTTVSEPSGAHDALIVCALSVASLGLDDLAATVAAAEGSDEAVAWRRARAQEFALRLRDALAQRLSNAELMIHVQEGVGADLVRIILTRRDDDSAAVENELAERVEAIRDRAWAVWSEQLRIATQALYGAAESAASDAWICQS
jgi:hypothetical protein